MIICRAPLRLSFGGGGTDIPSHYQLNGGEWYSIAINKYIYTSVNKRFYDKSLLRYSIIEEIKDLTKSKNKLLSALFKRYPINKSIEFTSISDIPAGTGLGSSGTFAVSSLMSIRSALNLSSTQEEIAKEASEIEIKDLSAPSGLQDQYISAMGGLRNFKVDKKGNVTTKSINLPSGTDNFFNDHIILIFTNISRSSHKTLSKFSNELLKGKALAVDKTIVPSFSSYTNALIKHNYIELGQLLDQYWNVKKNIKSQSTPSIIISLYEKLKQNGIIGGKLVGAGGGGFFMCVTKDIKNVKRFCNQNRLKYLSVKPDFEGVKSIELGQLQ